MKMSERTVPVLEIGSSTYIDLPARAGSVSSINGIDRESPNSISFLEKGKGPRIQCARRDKNSLQARLIISLSQKKRLAPIRGDNHHNPIDKLKLLGLLTQTIE